MSSTTCDTGFYCTACGAFLAPDERTETEDGPQHPHCAGQQIRRRNTARPALVGPVSLAEALAAGEGSIRLAISVPNGDYVALRAGGATLVRRVNQGEAREGSLASRLGTGEWVTAAECHAQAWRPA